MNVETGVKKEKSSANVEWKVKSSKDKASVIEKDKCGVYPKKAEKKLFCSSKLASDGSNDWRNISAKLKAHETSKEHIINMGAWIDLDMRLHKSKTIDKDVQEQINRDREHWKNEHVRRIKHDEIHNHYLGHNIQNELINLLASEIKNKIIDKTTETKYFSIILDCTPDASHQEQMSFILRSVDITVTPIRITEYFLEFLKVDDTSGKGLFEVIVDEIKSIGLDIDNLRGQGYDNGSNMKGKYQGVQKRLLDINPRSFYIPCGCHNLNLLIQLANIYNQKICILMLP
ncbi:uncharacterized protein [Nicotiana tomentosiformis]|uniref:uncharacterized protein n=1 Tax=Nicotiana tomentosiformis TaxID=4098 RepID=UPI00388CAD68